MNCSNFKTVLDFDGSTSGLESAEQVAVPTTSSGKINYKIAVDIFPILALNCADHTCASDTAVSIESGEGRGMILYVAHSI